MWMQYAAAVDSVAEQAEVSSTRASLRRMSGTILMLDNTNGQGAVVVPEEGEGDDGADDAEGPEDEVEDEAEGE